MIAEVGGGAGCVKVAVEKDGRRMGRDGLAGEEVRRERGGIGVIGQVMVKGAFVTALACIDGN